MYTYNKYTEKIALSNEVGIFIKEILFKFFFIN